MLPETYFKGLVKNNLYIHKVYLFILQNIKLFYYAIIAIYIKLIYRLHIYMYMYTHTYTYIEKGNVAKWQQCFNLDEV